MLSYACNVVDNLPIQQHNNQEIDNSDIHDTHCSPKRFKDKENFSNEKINEGTGFV